MAWNDLSIAQRSQLMNIMRHNGVTSLSEMRRLYDLSSPSYSSIVENTNGLAPVYERGGKKRGLLNKNRIVERVYGDAFGNAKNPVRSAVRQYFTNPDGAPTERIAKLQAIRDRYDLDNKSWEDAWNIWESMPDGQDKIDFYGAMYLDTVKQHEDAKRIYYGQPPIYGTMEPAQYQPTIGKGNNTYQLNELLTDDEFDNFVLPTWADWRGTYDSARTDQRKGNVGQIYDAPHLHDAAISEGFDNKGQYISIYDLWDYNTHYAGKSGDKVISTLTGGEPFDIYNRYYLDDWLDIPEGERGNPYIAPAYVEAERKFGGNKFKTGGEKPPYNGEIQQGKKWNFVDHYLADNPKVAHGFRKIGKLVDDAGRIMFPQRTRDVEINPRILTDFRDLSEQLNKTDNPDSAVDRMSRVATPAAAVARVGKPLLDVLNEEVLPWAEGARSFANKLRIADRIVNMGQFIDDFATPVEQFKTGGHKIHIKKANRGKFTALKKRTGHSASWFKAHGTPAQKKMAIFALNAKKWKHEHGGIKF